MEDKIIEQKEEELNIEHQKEIAKEAYRAIKRKMKLLSKNQLIQVIVDQVSRSQELQQIAQQLLAENKLLKGEINETDLTTNSDATSSNTSEPGSEPSNSPNT